MKRNPFPVNYFANNIATPYLRARHSIYTKNYACNIGRFIRCKKYKCICNVFRLSESAKRNLCDHRLDHVFRNGFHHVCFRNSRSNCIDTDSFWPKLSCQRDRRTYKIKENISQQKIAICRGYSLFLILSLLLFVIKIHRLCYILSPPKAPLPVQANI